MGQQFCFKLFSNNRNWRHTAPNSKWNMPFDHCNAFGFQLMLHYFTPKTFQERKCKTIRFTHKLHFPWAQTHNWWRVWEPQHSHRLIELRFISQWNVILFLLVIQEFINLNKKFINLIINNPIPLFNFAAFYLHFHKPCSKVSIIFQDACF